MKIIFLKQESHNKIYELLYKLIRTEGEYERLSNHSINIAKKFSQDLDDKKDAFVNEFIGNMISK